MGKGYAWFVSTVELHLKTTSYIRPPLIKTDFWRSRRIFSLFHIRQTSPNRPPLSDHFRPLSQVPAVLIDHDSTSLSDQLMLYFRFLSCNFSRNPSAQESFRPVYIEVSRFAAQSSSGGSQATTTNCPHSQEIVVTSV